MDITLHRLYDIVEGMPGNYIVYRAVGTELKFLHYTKGIPAMCGFTHEEFALIDSPYDIVIEEDRKMIRDMLSEYLQDSDRRDTDLIFRLVHKVLGFIWVHMTVKRYGESDGGFVFVASFLDVSKETHISYAMMDASDRYICVIEKATKRFLFKAHRAGGNVCGD